MSKYHPNQHIPLPTLYNFSCSLTFSISQEKEEEEEEEGKQRWQLV